jgi:phosphomevalonate kinase
MHTRATFAASAPGKMMIAGEYAVLEGAEAIVAAVGRRAYAQLGAIEAEGVVPHEAAAARLAAERKVGAAPGTLTIDVAELQQDGRKLGLGSSAAAAAAAAGVVFAAHGLRPSDPAVRDQVLAAALEGHRSVAPHGSGADVAAAVLGGFVRFRKLGAGVEAHSLVWPTGLELVVVWTGKPARTSDMLSKLRDFSAKDEAGYRARMRALADQSDQLVSALIAGDAAGAVEGVDGYGNAMEELGIAAGIGIVEETCARIREIARANRGAAKPSGAGGGDVAIAVFSKTSSADAFRAGCDQAGFEVLSLELGVQGERDEEPL